MEVDIPKQVKEIIEKFEQNNYQIYLVGGVVRDLILKRSIKDWDLTTSATPEQIKEIFPQGFSNNNFGTVGISTPMGIVEITTMRKESNYQDFRHPLEVSWTEIIEEDLARRDFTINSMALKKVNNSTFELIDPFHGETDLTNSIICANGDPKIRFSEDALRLLRAIRFASQLGFTIEDHTFQAIKDNAKLIEEISWERIRDEMLKIVSAPYAYEGMMLLRNSGLMLYILPEIERCFGLVQEGPKHDRVYDIGEHSLLSLKFCPSTDPITKFATLIHDVGKPDTANTQSDGNVTFYGHDVVGGRIAKQICQRFHFSNKEIDKICKLVRWHLFTVDENQTDAAIRRFIKNVGLENIEEMMALRVGDRLGGGTPKAISWRMEEYSKRIKQVLEKPFSVTDLKINGKDVMEILSIPPSRKVGEILDQLFQEVLEDSSKNNKEYLVKKIKEGF